MAERPGVIHPTEKQLEASIKALREQREAFGFEDPIDKRENRYRIQLANLESRPKGKRKRS